MAILRPGTTTGTGTLVTLGASDSLIVKDGVVLTSTDGTAIGGTVLGQDIVIRGSINSHLYAVSLSPGHGGLPGNSVRITEGASIVSSTTGGLLCHGFGTSVENHGLIDGARFGLSLQSISDDTRTTVLNTGTIRGGDLGVFRDSSFSTECIVLKNKGLIESEGMSYGYFAGTHEGRDRIRNTGRMVGDIEMQSGDDLYDGRKGFVDGVVNAGDGNDRIYGGNEGNVLNGDAGADKIAGGLGADVLAGGIGPDTFLFRKVAESRSGNGKHDSVNDFSKAEGDTIDLRQIDADSAHGGNQSFHFIGDKAFSHEAGELRYQFKGGETLVLGDVNGDGKEDFEIAVGGKIGFDKGDFIL